MARRCFISFKTEDAAYKAYIQQYLGVDMIDNSLNYAIDSRDEDYIMRRIREDHLAHSTVTIHLIGARSAEILGSEEQKFIKRELQASLFNGPGNTRNGILGVVLPEAHGAVYGGSYVCSQCGQTHNLVRLDDHTVVREFGQNYYIPNGRCCHTEEERYCVLTSWADFCKSPEAFIEMAFKKRTEPIAEKVRVRLPAIY